MIDFLHIETVTHEYVTVYHLQKNKYNKQLKQKEQTNFLSKRITHKGGS